MKVKVIYREPNGKALSHTLLCDPVEEEAAQHLCRKIAIQGFFMDEPDVASYIPPSQVLKVLLIK